MSVMRLDRPAHVFAVEEVRDEKPWFYDIKCFLQSHIYPYGASLKDKKTLRRLAGNFYLNGDWNTLQPTLVPYRDYTRRLLTFFTTVKLYHIPRDENQMADALATLSSMIKVIRWNHAPRIDVIEEAVLEVSKHIHEISPMELALDDSFEVFTAEEKQALDECLRELDGLK